MSPPTTADSNHRHPTPTMYEDEARRVGQALARMPRPLLDFGDVIKGLKIGKVYSRTGWNRENQFIFRVAGSRFRVSRPPLTEHFPDGTCVNYASHIDIKTPSGAISVWNPSQRDMEADDWYEVVGALKGSAS